MSCCGQKREQVQRALPLRQVDHPSKPSSFIHQVSRPQVIAFEYVGRTVLTAIGPVSGRHYRFSHPGAIVDVDSRDAPSFATVPTLRRKEVSGG
jgi:hypothetical protein